MVKWHFRDQSCDIFPKIWKVLTRFSSAEGTDLVSSSLASKAASSRWSARWQSPVTASVTMRSVKRSTWPEAASTTSGVTAGHSTCIEGPFLWAPMEGTGARSEHNLEREKAPRQKISRDRRNCRNPYPPPFLRRNHLGGSDHRNRGSDHRNRGSDHRNRNTGACRYQVDVQNCGWGLFA